MGGGGNNGAAAAAAGGSAGASGAVIGGAVGGGAALLIGGAAVVFIRRRRAARQSSLAKKTYKAAGGGGESNSRGGGGAVNPMLARVSVDVTMSGMDGDASSEASSSSPSRRATPMRMASAAGALSGQSRLANAGSADARVGAKADGDAIRAPNIFDGGPDNDSLAARASQSGTSRQASNSPPDYLSTLTRTPDVFLKPDVLDVVAARRAESTRNLLALSGASSRINALKTVSAGSGNRSTLNTKDSAGSGGGGGEAGSQREAAEAEANADLPDGWVAAWSKSRQIFYWRRAADNATSWEKPTQP